MPTRDSIAAYLGGSAPTEIVTVADPAAGAEWSYAPNLLDPVKLIVVRSIRFVFVADANVANRTIRLGLASSNSIVVAALEVFAGQFPITITAGQSATFSAAPGLNSFSAPGRATMSIPQTRLRQGDLAGTAWIRSSTVGIQAGDQYSDISLLLEIFDLLADPGP